MMLSRMSQVNDLACSTGVLIMLHVFNSLMPTVAMGTDIKHPVPDQVKTSFVIFDIGHSRLSIRVPGYQKLQMTG